MRESAAVGELKHFEKKRAKREQEWMGSHFWVVSC